MKIYGKITVRLMVWSMLIPLCGACASGESDLDTIPEGEISFSAQQFDMKSSSAVNNITQVEEGTYYLGYKEGVESVLNPIIIGSNGKVAKTGIYWTKVTKDDTKGANFTLSNVSQKEDGSYVIPDNRDILWAKDTKWRSALDFTLQHLMAQVRVKLSFGDKISSTVKSVYLVNVGADIQFNRIAGSVSTTTPTQGETELKKDDAGDYYYLFPAQDRRDEMMLKVVMTDGKVYARKLPFAMSQDIGNGNREDIPLRLRSGYILSLEAKVTDNPDLTVFFTGATLEDWKKIGDATIGVKPAGIYTSNELLEWAKEYENSRDGSNFRLQRYGVYDENASQWTFTLKRDIIWTAPIPTSPIITSFVDELQEKNVTGIKQEELLTIGKDGSVTTIFTEQIIK